ncbi:MAG: hypothetical protein E7259_10325 [Lachnospiraceae bacterium]|nr:hypothetical protein [Lachnospiraceae bacterium]
MKHKMTIMMMLLSVIVFVSCKNEEMPQESTQNEIIAFQELLDDWQNDENFTEIMQNCDSAEYGYYDIEDDGVKELIVTTVRGLAIFKYDNSEIKRIYWSTYSALLENGMIKYYRPGEAPENERYVYYNYDGSEYIKIATFERYDKDEDGDYDSGDLYIHDRNEVSKEEWDAKHKEYLEYKESVLIDTGEIFIEK